MSATTLATPALPSATPWAPPASTVEAPRLVLQAFAGRPPLVQFGDIAPRSFASQKLEVCNESNHAHRLEAGNVEKRDAIKVYPPSMEVPAHGSVLVEITWAPAIAGCELKKRLAFCSKNGGTTSHVELRGVCVKTQRSAPRALPASASKAAPRLARKPLESTASPNYNRPHRADETGRAELATPACTPAAPLRPPTTAHATSAMEDKVPSSAVAPRAARSTRPSTGGAMLRFKKPKPVKAAQSGAIFYDDRWIKKREEGFGAWVNFVLSVLRQIQTHDLSRARARRLPCASHVQAHADKRCLAAASGAWRAARCRRAADVCAVRPGAHAARSAPAPTHGAAAPRPCTQARHPTDRAEGGEEGARDP